MTVCIAACVAGLFAVENNRLIAHKLFAKDPEQIAKKLEQFEEGKPFIELEQLIGGCGFKEIVAKQPNPATDWLKQNFRRLAVELGFAKNQAELNEIIVQVGIAQAKAKISALQRRDKLIIQAVCALNDLDKILNAMAERLREWYGLHYPELNIADHEKFAENIAKYGHREQFEHFKSSVGMQLNDKDIEMLQSYAAELKNTYELRKKLEKYLEEVVPEEVPNINAMLGSILAARLLALAGSLEKLAKMSSSSIQTLGAERAMFRFLKERKNIKKGAKAPRPPKFGILFAHPDINTAKRELQGKIARLLSSKLTIASRADFYTKEDRSAQLLKDYKEKLAQIKGK